MKYKKEVDIKQIVLYIYLLGVSEKEEIRVKPSCRSAGRCSHRMRHGDADGLSGPRGIFSLLSKNNKKEEKIK